MAMDPRPASLAQVVEGRLLQQLLGRDPLGEGRVPDADGDLRLQDRVYDVGHLGVVAVRLEHDVPLDGPGLVEVEPAGPTSDPVL